MTRPALLATFALASLAVACPSPGTGVSYLPTDTVGADSVLTPDTQPGDDTLTPADTVQADTVQPDTTPVDTVQPDTTPADTTGPACVVGNPCSDDDPCTVNDKCVDGFCEGQRLTCNDDVACTVDSCEGGVCKHDPPAGQCLINATECVPGDQANPDNACQKCAPAQKVDGWTNDDGALCSDGDDCTVGEQCSGGACTGGTIPEEVCDDGVDNDCNSFTDDADPVCSDNPPCTYHTDCFPSGVCGYWYALGVTLCSAPCASAADCDAGQICSKVPGSMQVGYCQSPVPGGLVNGAGCSSDGQCASGLCNGVCMGNCLSESGCTAPNNTCQAVGDLNAGFIYGACGPNPAGTVNNGFACTTDNDNYDPGLCASGHCDFMNFALQALQGQQLMGPASCKALCKSELDCLPSSEECNIVLYSTVENPATIPPGPSVQVGMHDTLSACYTPVYTGSGQVGQACSANSDCSSAKCMPGIDDDNVNQGYCAGYCEFDQECPSGMSCQLSAVSINSQYLQITSQAFQGFQGPTGAYTLVRICKFD